MLLVKFDYCLSPGVRTPSKNSRGRYKASDLVGRLPAHRHCSSAMTRAGVGGSLVTVAACMPQFSESESDLAWSL